jgi:predicted chitinase
MQREEVKKLIVTEAIKQGIQKVEAIQYILATVEHETNGMFQPVKEAYWLDEAWRERNLSYFPYYGRGFIQITHKVNYEKFGKLLDVDLVKKPDLALDFNYAIFILIYGMKNGVFTGKKLEDYFNKSGSDFINARRIVNGKDRAKKIAILAQKQRVSYV